MIRCDFFESIRNVVIYTYDDFIIYFESTVHSLKNFYITSTKQTSHADPAWLL